MHCKLVESHMGWFLVRQCGMGCLTRIEFFQVTTLSGFSDDVAMVIIRKTEANLKNNINAADHDVISWMENTSSRRSRSCACNKTKDE